MSKIEVDAIEPQSGTALTIGASGDTATVPSGATLTIASGATITNSGTAVNFGATGSASWTTTVKTGNFTAVAGEGYFVNTTSGGINVTLPAGSAGAVVAIKDYANTFDTNNVTLIPNGSDKIGGDSGNKKLKTEGIAVTLIFIDSTKGWLVTDDGLQSNIKPLTYNVDFLVVAGGGAGGQDTGGGGGAGGYRNSYSSESSGGGGSSETALEMSPGTVYTITVGGGASTNTGSPSRVGGDGDDSSISGSDITDITSAGGGGGGGGGGSPGQAGGSGGGGGDTSGTAGAGTANQGFAGQAGGSGFAGAGGGAGEVGGTDGDGHGGDGLASSITGSSVTRGGGGAGCDYPATNTPGGDGGGGSTTNPTGNGGNGTANTGAGGGGGALSAPRNGGAGGSGVVILRMADADYSRTTTGSPTVTTGVGGSDTVLVFNGDGSYTA